MFLVFSPHGNICLNKDLQEHVLVPFLMIKNVSSYLSFWTYTKKWGWLFHCNTDTKAENITNIKDHTNMTSAEMTDFFDPTPYSLQLTIDMSFQTIEYINAINFRNFWPPFSVVVINVLMQKLETSMAKSFISFSNRFFLFVPLYD